MRDKRFITEHRGGPLKKEQHRQLIKWACGCAENVLPLFGEKLDDRLKNAGKSIDAERKWQNEQLPPEIMELVLTARSEKDFIIFCQKQ